HACRSMLERGSGHILNVSSASARRGLPWIGAYAASKAAVHAFTQALRLEMAGRGVRVSEILPISVSTSFFQRALGSGGYRPRGWVQTPEQVAERIARCAAWPRAELPGSFWTHWGLALEAAFPNTVNAVMEWLYRRQGQVGPGPGGRPEGA
ncbi:MAG TPA: SDR family NAD(P)-dependent oxidoreductase, partial [Candidatus Nitrosotenuis sp.]|nr:SDR family NAD(P)-dependent oxidoreductase [Candidatus Nitrosotenuis sp.]